MKKVKKLLSLLLILVFILPLYPPQTAYASRPRTFEAARVHKFTDYYVTLTIQRMEFYGSLRNRKLTEKKLDELIQEVLKEMGMTEEAFDLLNDAIRKMESHDTVTKEEFEKIRNYLYDIAGAVPGIGTAVSVIDALDKYIAQGDTAGAAQTLLEDAGGKFLEGVGDGLADADRTGNRLPGKVLGNSIGVIKALIAMYRIFQEDQMAQRVYDRAAGYPAMRQISTFYSNLNLKIDKYFKEQGSDYEIRFFGAEGKPRQKFRFLSERMDEKWILDMTLKRTESGHSWDIDGKYEGTFEITIYYDLKSMPDALLAELNSNINMSAILTNRGTAEARRVIKGNATANVYGLSVGSSRHSRVIPPNINAKTDSDEKIVDVSDISFHCTLTDDTKKAKVDADFIYSADETDVNYLVQNHLYTTSTGETQTIPDEYYFWAWWENSTIWERGDYADVNWKIEIESVR